MAPRAAREPDPPSQIRALSATVSGTRPLARGYVVRGEERYFREAAIRILTESARARGHEVSRHDAQDPDFDPRRLGDDLTAAPLFAGARLVLVRGASSLLKKEGREPSSIERALLAFLRSASPSGTVVVDADSLRADHAIAKAVIELGGLAVHCRRLWDTPPPWDPDPRRTEVVLWLVGRARERNIALDAADAVYVVQATGGDLGALDAALDRVAERKSQGVRSVVSWTSSASPFEIAEHLCRGDAARALAGIEQLFRTGFEGRDGSREIDPAALLAILFGSLRSKLRQSSCGARAIERGLDLPRAAEEAGVRQDPRSLNEFAARVSLRDARAWSAMLDDLAEIERRTRTSSIVDASDLALLGLRWRVAPASRSVRDGASGGFVARRR
jgi:DNA polymerase III delta subunit